MVMILIMPVTMVITTMSQTTTAITFPIAIGPCLPTEHVAGRCQTNQKSLRQATEATWLRQREVAAIRPVPRLGAA
jgi:hypothetical protein